MPTPSPSLEGDPLASYRWRSRRLVVFAEGPADYLLARQGSIMAAMAGEARERDLVVIEALGRGSEADTLRRHLGVGERSFAAVRVGKDGGAKIVSEEPLTPERLMTTIDAMPMRRQEMRR
jgi:hypothetical protein